MNSAFTASTLPARAACISGVSPALTKLMGSFGSAPAFISWSMMAALPCLRGERQRRDAVVVRGVHVRAGADEHGRCLGVVQVRGPVQRRGAISSAAR